jgi:hypothetical protein
LTDVFESEHALSAWVDTARRRRSEKTGRNLSETDLAMEFVERGTKSEVAV